MRDRDQIILESLYNSIIIEKSALDSHLISSLSDDFNYGILDKRDLLKFIEKYGSEIVNFMMGLRIYQSSYLYINPNKMYNLYMKLPKELKKRYFPNEQLLQSCARGDDFVQHKKALSFTTSIRTAKEFGNLIFAIEDFASYDGILYTSEVVKDETYRDLTEYLNIGDDEEEIIVFGGKWKKEVYQTKDKNEPNDIYSLILDSPRTLDIKNFVYDVLNKKKPVMPDSVAEGIIERKQWYIIFELIKNNIQIPQSIFNHIADTSEQNLIHTIRSMISIGYPIPDVIYNKIVENPRLNAIYKQNLK